MIKPLIVAAAGLIVSTSLVGCGGSTTTTPTVGPKSPAAVKSHLPVPSATPVKPTGKVMLPDLRIADLADCSSTEKKRNLGQCFSIQQDGDRKLLKFPVTTINVGNGPLEIHAKRSGLTTNDWAPFQRIYFKDGETWDVPNPDAEFYYAGDGHEHWHIRDFDSYSINGEMGKSEKHGFCFEDNARWSKEATDVYTHDESCGQGQPDALEIVHGLSVGNGDTYPTTLPDQAINITGLPDGEYTIKVTADWQNFWQEVNESNNVATARIEIRGSLVRLISATGA